MIAPVFDEIPAYEQAFSPNLLFFQHPQIPFCSGVIHFNPVKHGLGYTRAMAKFVFAYVYQHGNVPGCERKVQGGLG